MGLRAKNGAFGSESPSLLDYAEIGSCSLLLAVAVIGMGLLTILFFIQVRDA